MNPFDLRGPEFLLLFGVFAAVWTMVLHLVRRLNETTQPGETKVPLNDPYQIAYLRGGRNEAIRAAVISLIERGLLERHDKNELMTARSAPRAGDLFEQEVLRFFLTRRQAPDAFKQNSGSWDTALAPRREALERAGLIPDAERRSFRNWLAALGASTLFIVGLIKIEVGMGRGKPVLFLVFMTLIAIGLHLAVMFSYRRTTRGDRALEDIQEIFSGLRSTASGTADLVMLYAVFGMLAMPFTALPYLPELYPQAAKDGGSGSSCGSSCGSGCGGGGGCGGGCGGCGS